MSYMNQGGTAEVIRSLQDELLWRFFVQGKIVP